LNRCEALIIFKFWGSKVVTMKSYRGVMSLRENGTLLELLMTTFEEQSATRAEEMSI